MRILHTADWHLGHTLHDVSREYEHDRFLEWLLERLDEFDVDALLMAGDVFDVANPSAAAQRRWYRFCADAHRRRPAMEIVVIAGNHDSPTRLLAPKVVLSELNVHVVGAVPQEFGQMVVPLTSAGGDIEALCMAVPFLRPTDLSRARIADDEPDRIIASVRAIYDATLEAALAQQLDGQAIVAMGHTYMSGTEISELSERKILRGNQHALPASMFPDSIAYVALGHLHLPQQVGSPRVRYSGSPIPLSLSEVDYKHQILLVDLEDGALAEITPVLIPRAVEMLRVGPGAPEEVVGLDEAMRPLLEARVRLEKPDPTLRRRVGDALDGREARLVKLTVETAGSGRSLLEGTAPGKTLQDLDPVDVFRECYQRSHEGEPDRALMDCFLEILEAVQQEEEGA
ncbi:MAG: exonuclease SbcCD subunit D C-terminal domain-containing protein [Planctomycetota bacterium]|jgi:exonuclease SbcD